MFRSKPARGQTTEEISYEKLLECTHTDEIADSYLRLKPKKKRKKPKDDPITEPRSSNRRPFTPEILSSRGGGPQLQGGGPF